ncbi:MAG TPA: phosphatidylserine decarboxylase [Euryarchaeota archaeon]|nr:MAG: phosphatidylserine decarboxylase family protein [Thermoplasmatales archaeon ex4484_6]RLF67230.1 MAG: phosphatidylserine decarboxylase family protein [Thermoplasmata archaeon]HHD16826.1 phosphatidylserine decarboxylase [Euryarchaeota archaeon]
MLLAKGTPLWILSIPLSASICSVLGIIMELSFLMIIGIILLLLFLPVIAFFRDPERPTGAGVVSPADGKVTRVVRNGGWTEISIFMNIHDVHVNRAPWRGKIVAQEHIRGSFKPAFSKDSDRNERLRTVLRTERGDWEIVQIAGAVARRIVPYVEVGDTLEKGERFGMIRFGSRVDLRFRVPRGHSITVSEGDRVKAGTSSLAR